MNNKIAKELRQIIDPTKSEIERRVYRRLKKQYKSLSEHAKRDFIEEAKRLFEMGKE